MSSNIARKNPGPVAIWVWLCAFLNCAGWALSALHELNPAGYAAALAIGLAAILFWKKSREGREAGEGKKLQPSIFSRPSRDIFRKLFSRFRKPFPLAFLILAAMAFLGGAIYAPNNFDALTYRIPRVLHWLAANQWQWIHTPDPRMNTRACGFEWLTAPLLALTRSDRLFFLPNLVSFLLLPGLIFGVFTRLGVRRCVAWHWMWLLPAGFCFILQAGSVANDLFGAVFALAALDFALRAIKSRQPSDVWLSILAAALLTGAKASNLPLLLPWFVALLFSVRLLLKRPVILAAVAVMAFFSSFLPNAIFNFEQCGDWTGSVLEPSPFRIHKPLIGIAGNSANLILQNLPLPVMPLPHETGEKIAREFLPQTFLAAFDGNFETYFGSHWGSGIQTEDGAGLGFGFCLLIPASLLAALFYRRRFAGGPARIALARNQRIILLILPWISLMAYMTAAGMAEAARLVTPYYALLLPLLLACPAHELIVRQRWWRWSALAIFLMAFFLLILSPPRPLFPAQTVFKHFNPKNAFLARSEISYFENFQRHDALGAARDLLPKQIGAVGFVSGGNDIETSLWLPYGSRQVEDVLPSDGAADLRARGIQYVVLAGETLAARGETLDGWLKKYDAKKIGQVSIVRTMPPYVPAGWFVARLEF